MQAPQEERKIREIEFHNEAYEKQQRQSVMKFYIMARKILVDYEKVLVTNCAGKKILEYGCGEGSYAFTLAEHGADVTGFDISDFAIETAKKTAADKNLRIHFLVMDAEYLEFDSGTFDIVCGSGILHHLILDRALKEVKRVLRKGGSAVFAEPLGHNPFINLFRKLTPSMRSKDEHPLRAHDLKIIQQMFPDAKLTYYCFTTLLCAPFVSLPFRQQLINFFNGLDRVLFRVLPFLQRYAWQVLIELPGV